jgi:hypothetical protein
MSSRSDVRRSPAALGSRGLPGGTPQATSHATSPSITEERRKDRRNPRRAAVSAPAAGPSTWPSVMPSWISDTSRRTSPPDRPAMMKANVDTAPMSPRSTRATSISGSVRASAMPKKPSPWNA